MATQLSGPPNTGTSTSTSSAGPRARARREPAVVVPGRNTKVRARVRTQWLVLAAALTILAGMLVAWALTRAADRVAVVSVAQPIAAGTVIELDDLTTTGIAFDGDVQGLVPAASLDTMVGRVATLDLQPGTLLTVGMWADATGLGPGERTVGAVLEAGRYPVGLAQGSAAMAVALDGAPDGGGDSAAVAVRVIDADLTDSGDLHVTVAAPDTDATRLAQLAATDRLVLIGLPAGAAP